MNARPAEPQCARRRDRRPRPPHEIGHALIDNYEQEVRPNVFGEALAGLDEQLWPPQRGRRPNRLQEFGAEPIAPTSSNPSSSST